MGLLVLLWFDRLACMANVRDWCSRMRAHTCVGEFDDFCLPCTVLNDVVCETGSPFALMPLVRICGISVENRNLLVYQLGNTERTRAIVPVVPGFVA